tara:strand:+ start:290 stop:2254 length:1965 start_codon:yes stop_codon:yes gene_type:complete
MSKFNKRSFTVDTSGASVDTEVVVVKPKKVFTPTPEQEAAKDLALQEDICKIQACSGSGKTSELVYISSFLKKPSLYMTFNVTMAAEASGKFGSHVSCMTTHSLAHRKVGKGYSHKLNRPQGRYVNVALTGNEIARFFRLPDFEVNGDEFISKNLLGLIIKQTVGSFEVSAEDTLSGDHIPYSQMKALKEKYGDQGLDLYKLNKFIKRFALKLWEERTDKYSEVCCTHNTYLKLYQLSNPDLSEEYEVIYLDEAQDLNSVTRSIVLAQTDKCKVIFVGDKFQQIYAWNGSVNALQSIKCKSAPLSKSFRFGTKIAELATLILEDEMVVEGFDKIDSKVGLDVVDTSKPYTILFRTNMELIFTAVKMITKGDTVNVNIDMKDFVAMLKSAKALYDGDMKQVKHEDIVPFPDWKDLVQESESDAGLGRLVHIVEQGDPVRMLATLHSHRNTDTAKVTLTTAHKSKGLEYPQVVLANDFPSNYNRKGAFVGLTEEERNLLYVAATRAINNLNINNTCAEFYEIRGKHYEDLPEETIEDLLSSEIDEYYEDGRVLVGDTIYDNEIELLAAESADIPWYDPDNEEWMNTGNNVEVLNISSGAEQASYELQSVVQMEALRDDYANHNMSLEGAFEYGFVDSLGCDTEMADFNVERILPFT